MSSLSCSVCQHANPAGAKFCNECGFALGLEPCGHCDAINDRLALRCHQCGAEISAASGCAAAAGLPALESRPHSDSSVVRALETMEADAQGVQDTKSAHYAPSRKPVRLGEPSFESSSAGETRPTIIAESGVQAEPLHTAQLRQEDIRTRLGLANSRGEQPAQGRRRGVVTTLAVVTACGVAFFAYQQTTREGPWSATRSPGSSSNGGQISTTPANAGQTSAASSQGPGANDDEPSAPLQRPPVADREQPAPAAYGQPPATAGEPPPAPRESTAQAAAANAAESESASSVSASDGRRPSSVTNAGSQPPESAPRRMKRPPPGPANHASTERASNSVQAVAPPPSVAPSPDQGPTGECTANVAALGLCGRPGAR